MEKYKKVLKNAFIMVVIPLTVYILFYILCLVNGVKGFGVGTDLIVMFRNMVYTGFIAMALSYNLTSGRLDFSIGSTLILSSIIGGMLTLQLDLGPMGFLLITLVSGAILGTISGLAYTILGLPPMVVSLGVAMIYEAIAFTITGGAGVRMIGRNDLLIWSASPYIYILAFIIVGVLYIVLNKTQFGYNTNSLRSGQEIAVNTGINERKNAVTCYLIAGTLMGAAGVINASVLGTITPNLGLASSAYLQSAFLPMFIGNILAKYFDRNVGVMMGALTQSIMFAGIGKLGVPSAWQSVITGVVVLLFFAYSFNAYRIVEFKMFKEKRQKAIAAQR